MRRNLPHILFLAALAFAFLPSAGSAQVGICSDDFCADIPGDHPCQCPHCPWVFVECDLRYTCAFASPPEGSLAASETSEQASTPTDAALVSTELGETRAAAEPALDRQDLFEATEALEPPREGEAH